MCSVINHILIIPFISHMPKAICTPYTDIPISRKSDEYVLKITNELYFNIRVSEFNVAS